MFRKILFKSFNISLNFFEFIRTAFQKLHFQYYDLFEALRFETNPMAAKRALNLMQLPSGSLRSPLTPLSESKTEILKSIMQKKNLI